MDEPAVQASPQTTLFSVLGPLSVTLDGERVRLGGPRQVAALAQLLVNPGHVISMDQLIEGVWDGDSPKRPDVTIRSYLSNLRRAIEPWRHKGDRQSCIESWPPGYRIVMDTQNLDANRFESAVAEGRRAMGAGDSRRAVGVLHAGRDLWRGEPYESVPDNDAVMAARSRLCELHLVSAELLAEARMAEGDHETVVSDLDELLGRHPLRERLTELSMLALYRSGRQSEALLVCTRLRARLVERLGLDPGPRIQELESKILSQDESLLVAESHRMPILRTSGPLRGPTIIVGRSRERLALATVRSALAEGRGATALVTGEPGSGKSALISDLCHGLEPHELAVWGRCRAVATGQALWPWGQILDGLLSGLPDLSLDGLDGLRSVAPGWPEPDQAPEPSTDEQLAPSCHFPAVVELLRRAARSQPLVIVIEDAHWADEPSIELLAHAGHSLSDLPIAFVAAWRNTELRGPQPRHVLRQLVRMPSMVRIELDGLDRRSVAQLAAAVGLASGAVDELFESTAGNPLLVSELVAGSAGSAAAHTDDNVWLQPTANLRDLVLERIERAHEDAPAILHSAAICQAPFSPEVIGDAIGLDRSTLDEAMDALVAAGLLTPVDGEEWRYRFVHPITGSVLTEQLSSPRRARLHTELGQSAWRLGRPAAEVARHFASSGSTATSILAARFALESVAGTLLCSEVAAAAEIVANGLTAIEAIDNTSSLKVEFGVFLAHWARMTGDDDRVDVLIDQTLRAAATPHATTSDRVQASLLASGRATPGPAATHLDWLGCRLDDRLGRLELSLDGLPPEQPEGNDVELALAVAREDGRRALASGTTQDRSKAADHLAHLLEARSVGPDNVLVNRLRLLGLLGDGRALDLQAEISETATHTAGPPDSLLWLDATVLRATFDLYQGSIDAAEQALQQAARLCRGWDLDTTDSIDHLLRSVADTAPIIDLDDPVDDAALWVADARSLGQLIAAASRDKRPDLPEERQDSGLLDGGQPDTRTMESGSLDGGQLDPRTMESGLADSGMEHAERSAIWCRRALLARCAIEQVGGDLLGALLSRRSTILTANRGLVLLGPGSYYAAHAALAAGEVEMAEELVNETEQHARTAGARPLLARTLRIRAEIGALKRDPQLVEAARAEVAALSSAITTSSA